MVNQLYLMRNKLYTEGLLELIYYIQKHIDTKNLSMIEIGSYAGESTELFAKNFKEVISIDPFINDYDPTDLTCSFMKLEDVYHRFSDRISKYDNIKHIRKTSDAAINDLDKYTCHFVYIDGLHTYEQLKKDINNYKKLIEPSGFIGGHDYHPNWSGIITGVNEIFGQPDLTFVDTSWIKKI
jgi:hypothetical protein